MRSFWLATDIEPILTPEQIMSLDKFFADVDEEKRRRAIHFIDSGVKLYHAEKENPLDPLGAARQIARIKNGIEAVVKDLCALTPGTEEALHLAAMHFAEGGNLDFWKLRQDLCGGDLCHRLCYTVALCNAALGELTEVDNMGHKKPGRPKGKKPDHDWVLAGKIVEAFCIAFDRPPKRLANDKTEVDKIYKIIDLYKPTGILRQVIELNMEIKSSDQASPLNPDAL